jgi:hypothetical protein
MQALGEDEQKRTESVGAKPAQSQPSLLDGFDLASHVSRWGLTPLSEDPLDPERRPLWLRRSRGRH